MIITFTGHSKIFTCDALCDSIYSVIMENTIKNDRTVFYCGGYGKFDNLCAKICGSIRDVVPNCEVVYVTPYILSESKRSKKLAEIFRIYDSILYPPIEKVPPKYAVSKRNQWMIDQADLIIAYVDHTYGGAYNTLEYARRRNKRIINFAEINE